MVTEPLIYIFKRRDSTDNAIVSDLANGKRIRLYQIFDHKLLLIPGFHICHKHFIGTERFDKLHLVGEDICLVLVVQIIVYHAPDRSFTRARGQGDDLHRMLAIEDIVDPISTAYLHRVDLIQIKVCRSIQHMLFGNIPLVLLIGYEVLDGNLFEVNIGNKHTIIFH